MAPSTLSTSRDIYHPDIDARGGGNVNQTHFSEHSKLLPWLMLCAMLSSLGVSFSVFALIWASISARETKQLQLQVQDQNALLLREGIKLPGDQIYGPEGNLNYRRERAESPRKKE